MIRLAVPNIDEDDISAVRDVLLSKSLVQGLHVAKFEKQIAKYIGSRHAIAVNSGTSALHLALLSLGTKVGDICITTAYSWVATANVIELCGARPIFVDIDPQTFNLNPERLEDTLNRLMANSATARRVRAVIPVHAFGQMADMTQLMAVCSKWDIPIVEDAACALGARWDRRCAGTVGSVGCFSFHPRKAITTGEGGMVVTDDDVLAECIRSLRNHGINSRAPAFDFVMPGYNNRMTEFQAALGGSQMSKLQNLIAARRAAATNYDRLLVNGPLQAPKVSAQAFHVYQSYVTLLPKGHAQSRASLISQSRENGVEVQVGTIHMPLTTYYKERYGFKIGDFSVTDDVESRSLSLPLFDTITEDEQQEVVSTVTSCLKV